MSAITSLFAIYLLLQGAYKVLGPATDQEANDGCVLIALAAILLK